MASNTAAGFSHFRPAPALISALAYRATSRYLGYEITANKYTLRRRSSGGHTLLCTHTLHTKTGHSTNRIGPTVVAVS